MSNAANLPTSELFDLTNSALHAGRWSEARSLLDDLGRRDDNRDELCRAESYGCPAHLLGVIGDRIDLVNSKA